MIKKKSISRFISLIIISLAVAPGFALGQGDRNLFMIDVMEVAPIINLMKFSHKKNEYNYQVQVTFSDYDKTWEKF